MDSPINQHTSRKEFWRAHIELAELFNGTNKEYCLKHGLHPGSFSSYRKKLGYSKPRKEPQKTAAFSQVQVKPKASELSTAKLPDPNWLAEFLKALGSLS